MISAEQVLYELHMQLHPDSNCVKGTCRQRDIAARLAPLVHDHIKAACAEVAEEIAQAVEALDLAPGQHDEFYPGLFTAAAKAREIGQRK